MIFAAFNSFSYPCYQEGRVGIPLTVLNPPHCCAYPKPGPGFPMSCLEIHFPSQKFTCHGWREIGILEHWLYSHINCQHWFVISLLIFRFDLMLSFLIISFKHCSPKTGWHFISFTWWWSRSNRTLKYM